MSGVFQKCFRYWHTLRYLKLTQIIKRVQRHFRRSGVDLSIQGDLRNNKNPWAQPAKRDQRMVMDKEFCFLNECHVIDNIRSWNNEKWPKLWIYNLHYFDDLTAVDAHQRSAWHRSIIQRWVIENPVGFGNGWEPYPSSLRIVNWIKWSLAGNGLENPWLHSLAIQVRYLANNLETHLLGNHLFANAKALLFAGLFFKNNEAEIWYEIGLNIIKRELPEQVLNDGGNFELSTMYHEIFLEDLLDIVNLHRTFDHDYPAEIKLVIPKMLYWLSVMCHPDGEIGFFNDAAIGVSPSVSELFIYAKRLGFETAKPVKGLTELPDSGYSRIETDEAVILIDRAAIGPDYLPAHAHADTLSFELSLFGRRVIVNSGTSVYGMGVDRHQQRSTAAHSTVVLDGENSSEVWGGFRVARRAKVYASDARRGDGFIVSGCHDGYKRLTGRPMHCRTWNCLNSSLNIHDEINGCGDHSVEAILYLHPDVEVEQVFDECVTLSVDGHIVKITYSGAGSLFLEDSMYHPEFGLSVDNKKLVYCVDHCLPINVITKILW